MLLQRIMAAHCVTDEQANKMMDEIDDELDADTLTECLSSINKGLKCFGLEIATMIGKDGERHHAIINQHACEVAKKSFAQVDAHHRAFIRLLLEQLVDGPCVRSTLINLRGDLKDPLKMDLDGADKCIETLLEEHWLCLEDEGKLGDMHSKIQLGPRAFLELTHLLTDMGYPDDDLPQFIFHR